jgi:hypothetical protein
MNLKLLHLRIGFLPYFMPFSLTTFWTFEPLPWLPYSFVSHTTRIPEILLVSTWTFDQPLSGSSLDCGEGFGWKNEL